MALLCVACTAAHEGALRADLRAYDRYAAPDESPPPPPGGALEDYVAYAAARHPSLSAAYHRWRAAVRWLEPARPPRACGRRPGRQA